MSNYSDCEDISDGEQQPLLNSTTEHDFAKYPSIQDCEEHDEPAHFHTLSLPPERRRTPLNYGSYANQQDGVAAALSRYKYYNKLTPHSTAELRMPHHVVPDPFIISIFLPLRQSSQSSLITVFAMWNTMVGTSLLSMPWGLQQSGFASGIVIVVLVALLMFYTSYRVIKSTEGLDLNVTVFEFSDVCRHYLGKWAEMSSLVFSLTTLLGAAIVYWILMSNFLYNTVNFIYVHINGGESQRFDIINATGGNVYCPSGISHHHHYNITPPNSSHPVTHHPPVDHPIFWQVWHIQKTVPFFLIIIILPLVNFKSPTFFTKFNSLGTISVLFLVVFVTVKAVRWGLNIDFMHVGGYYSPEFRVTFPSLSGVSALALFIHNCVLSILRNKKTPEHNTRDLGLAYLFVTMTYLYIGITFYVTFPTDKSCIEDNFLNNILSTDILAFIARVFLVIQMVAVFPLLLYVFRVQLLNTLFGSVWPSFSHRRRSSEH